MTTDASTKEAFFEPLGALSDDMIAAHGRDFAMGALILAARFIAQGQPVADAANASASKIIVDH
ncbi:MULTISPECIES: hypothetical protein [unclassified Caballeronia]|uniref:hypothetical protein n=1 Tax=unclassified Caballeronia TaxID=2646786 RepID=UPI0020292745|nr:MULTISPECIES: hypothetical protein [unclassified Caballeronia]